MHVLSTATRLNPCGSKARKYNVGGASPAALPRQGDRLWERLARQQGRLQHLFAEQILSVRGCFYIIYVLCCLLTNYDFVLFFLLENLILNVRMMRNKKLRLSRQLHQQQLHR